MNQTILEDPAFRFYIPQVLDSSLNQNNNEYITATIGTFSIPYELKDGNTWDSDNKQKLIDNVYRVME